MMRQIKSRKAIVLLLLAFALLVAITSLVLMRLKLYDYYNLRKMNRVFQSYTARGLVLAGVVIDDKGNPLNGVTVEIEKVQSNYITMTDARSRETVIVNSAFSFKYTGWHDVQFVFEKQGYYPVREMVSVMEKVTGDNSNIKENVAIILRETGTFAKNLQKDVMRLKRETQYDKSIRKTGWVYKKRECEKYGIYERVNNIPYDDPSEVDIYAERAEDGGGIYLIANDENTGFTELMDAKDFTYLPEAPEEGYQSRLLIPYLPLAPGDDPKRRRSADWRYCYFKLKEGFYGKMKIEASERENGDAFSATCIYYLNPDGSRNLRSMDR